MTAPRKASDPLRAADFVRQIVRQTGERRGRDAFSRALDEALRPDQREHCQVMGFRDGKLTLEVDSAPLFAELSGFRREELRLRMNEALPDRKIAVLQFRLGGTGHV